MTGVGHSKRAQQGYFWRALRHPGSRPDHTADTTHTVIQKILQIHRLLLCTVDSEEARSSMCDRLSLEPLRGIPPKALRLVAFLGIISSIRGSLQQLG